MLSQGHHSVTAAFSEMGAALEASTRELKGLVMLRTADPQPTDALTTNMRKIDEQLRAVENDFVALQGAISAEKQSCELAQEFSAKVNQQAELLAVVRDRSLCLS